MRTPSTRQLLTVGGISLGILGAILLLASSVGITAPAVGGVLLFIGWALLGIWTIGERQSRDELKGLRADLSTHEARQLDRTRRIESAIEAERAKESRHEYVQERALERIEGRVREFAASNRQGGGKEHSECSSDVLFVTSNGAGLGHLTRLLAVAENMDAGCRVEFLTLSRAYEQIAHMGYPIRYFPSAEATDIGVRLWNTTFRSYLQDVFAESLPHVVVFDGTVVYEGIVDVCRANDVPLIWMQRGCWKPEADERYPMRRAAAKVADHVIVPGDYACDEMVEVGPGVGVTRVGPIVLTREEDMLSAEVAKDELELSPSSRHVLFNLGGGILTDSSLHRKILIDLLSVLPNEFEITIVRSPLAEPETLPLGVNVIEKYPISRYARAFDFSISAAGYNTVQEAGALRIPMILFPNEQTQTDDQVRRAEEAAERGWAHVARNPEEVVEMARMLAADELSLNALSRALDGLARADGALAAANAIQRIIESAVQCKATARTEVGR